jgi:hypothetical protein
MTDHLNLRTKFSGSLAYGFSTKSLKPSSGYMQKFLEFEVITWLYLIDKKIATHLKSYIFWDIMTCSPLILEEHVASIFWVEE